VFFHRALLLLLLTVALAGCGELSRPFAGNPGATARRLAQPPPARLAVPAPTEALLADAAGAVLANALATALQAQEVPAVAEAPQHGDWRLVTSAELRGGEVVPCSPCRTPRAWARAPPRAPRSPAPPGPRRRADDARRGPIGCPKIASLLTRIEAARQQSDPNSLVNRPARCSSRGAWGSGGRQHGAGAAAPHPASRARPVVQDTAAGADYVLEGRSAWSRWPAT